MVCVSSGMVAAILFPCPCAGTTWLCAGNSVLRSKWVSSPPTEPIECEEELHRTARPPMLGKLNVVEPSPSPYAVPIISNKSAYVSLDTAYQKAIKQLDAMLPKEENIPKGDPDDGFDDFVSGRDGS